MNRPGRETVALVCIECKARNYATTKRREQMVERNKFCPACGKHTVHRDAK